MRIVALLIGLCALHCMPTYLPLRSEYAPPPARVNIGPFMTDTRRPAALLNGASYQVTEEALAAFRRTLLEEFSRRGSEAKLIAGQIPVPVFSEEGTLSASELSSPRYDTNAVKRLAAGADLLLIGVARFTNVGAGILGSPGGQCMGVSFSSLRLHLLLFDAEGRLLLDSQDIDARGYASEVTLHSVERLADSFRCRSVARDHQAIASLLAADGRRLVGALAGAEE